MPEDLFFLLILVHIQLQDEAASTLQCMDKCRDGGFEETFLTKIDFPAKYDYCVRYFGLICYVLWGGWIKQLQVHNIRSDFVTIQLFYFKNDFCTLYKDDTSIVVLMSAFGPGLVDCKAYSQ